MRLENAIYTRTQGPYASVQRPQWMYLSIKPSAYVIVTDSMKLAPKPPQIPPFPPSSNYKHVQPLPTPPTRAPKLGTRETGHEALLDPQHSIQSHKNHKALYRRDVLPPDKWKRYRDCKLGIKCWYERREESTKAEFGFRR